MKKIISILAAMLLIFSLTACNTAKTPETSASHISYETYYAFIVLPDDESHSDSDKYIYPENIYEENGELIIEGAVGHTIYYEDGISESEQLEANQYRFSITEKTSFTKRENRSSDSIIDCTCEEFIKDIEEIPNTGIMLETKDGLLVLATRTE